MNNDEKRCPAPRLSRPEKRTTILTDPSIHRGSAGDDKKRGKKPESAENIRAEATGFQKDRPRKKGRAGVLTKKKREKQRKQRTRSWERKTGSTSTPSFCLFLEDIEKEPNSQTHQSIRPKTLDQK